MCQIWNCPNYVWRKDKSGNGIMDSNLSSVGYLADPPAGASPRQFILSELIKEEPRRLVPVQSRDWHVRQIFLIQC